jgi:hypothetical protein
VRILFSACLVVFRDNRFEGFQGLNGPRGVLGALLEAGVALTEHSIGGEFVGVG